MYRSACVSAKITLKQKHETLSHMWDHSHGVNLSSSCGTGPQAFCAGDASLDAPASHEQPAPLRGCAPVARNQKKKHKREHFLHYNVSIQLAVPQLIMDIKAESDLFLHQILQMCDPLRILWVTADVILIKERLLSRRMSQKVMISNTSSIHTSTQI